MALTKNQKEIVDSIKGEFERINAQSKEQKGTFFDIGNIKSEYNRKEQLIGEIKLNNRKFIDVANEMAQADFKALKPDMDSLGIPISLFNPSEKSTRYQVLIGDLQQCGSYWLKLGYGTMTEYDNFANISKTIGIERNCYVNSNSQSTYSSLEKFTECIGKSRIKTLYEHYQRLNTK